MSLKEQLSDIDLQLEVMPENNRKMLYASIFVGSVMFAYYVFGLELQAEHETKLTKVAALEKKLADNKVSLFESKIKNTENRILVLAEGHQHASYKAQSLRTKLEKMDYLSSDAAGLADMLERILKESVVLGINVEQIILDDSRQEYKAQIEKRGSIIIEGGADFRSVLKLLQFIEAQEALMEISNIHFDLDDKSTKPSFEIIITGYGISL